MYKVEVRHKEDQRFEVVSKDATFIADTKGGGMTPPDVLLAGLGSCLGVYIRKYAETSGLDLSGFSLAVEAEFSGERPVCFRKIKVTVDLKGAPLDERRKEALLSFIKNCPVHNTLKSNPDTEIAFV